MLFNSLHYIFFLACIVAMYYALPHKHRWWLLLLSSCYFYMAFVPIYVLILAFTIGVDYFAGLWIEKSTGKRRRNYLIISIISNIAILATFKYYNFINENFSFLLTGFGLKNPIPYLSILLPIGLSFHTFQAMSYTIEVYRGHQAAERHFGIYALYVMFFPQLVAGPIERPQNMLHQFKEVHPFDPNRISEGLKMIVWGLFKKIVVADRLALYVNASYENVGSEQGWPLILATIFFSFQVYCDFSAYSDIAIGSAKLLGFDLMQNFNRPNLSRTTTEYWKRWHISLSTWFRDYLFIPLGGSKTNLIKRCFNLMIVFLISGLWHGASWTFVIWGAINGIYLVGALVRKKMAKKMGLSNFLPENKLLSLPASIITTFLLITFSRIFFRAANIQDAFIVVKKVLHPSGSIFSQGTSILVYASVALGILLTKEIKNEFFPNAVTLSNHPNFWMKNSYYAMLIILILTIGVFDGGQFIYFQF